MLGFSLSAGLLVLGALPALAICERLRVNPESSMTLEATPPRRAASLFDRLRRKLAPNCIHQQLYPAPSIQFRFRQYCDDDRDALIDLHDSNAPNRFPKNHRPEFEKHLDSKPSSLFVAVGRDESVLACCGVSMLGERVNVLHYGLVAPDHQGKGIGSTMTLTRLILASSSRENQMSLMFAVPRSLGFYQRFGYNQIDTWKGVDGKDYPTAMLVYNSWVLEPIRAILGKRGHLLDPGCEIDRDQHTQIFLEEDDMGISGVRVENKKDGDA